MIQERRRGEKDIVPARGPSSSAWSLKNLSCLPSPGPYRDAETTDGRESTLHGCNQCASPTARSPNAPSKPLGQD